MEEIEDLKNEIEILNKRISILERKENNRRAYKYLKLIIKVVMLLLFAYGLWRGYEYVVNELPNMIEDRIKSINPFNKS